LHEKVWSTVESGGVESVTSTVKVESPTVVGVPVIMPVEPLRVSPGGSWPFTTDQWYGGTPPVTVTSKLKGVPTMHPGISLGAVICSGGGTTKGITEVDELGEAETPLGSVAVAVAVFERVPRATSAAVVV